MNIDLDLPQVLRAIARQFDLLEADGCIKPDVDRITVRLPGQPERLCLFTKQDSGAVYKPGAGPTRL